MIEIKFDEQQMNDLRKLLGDAPKQIPGIMRGAINRATTQLRRDILQRTTRAYGIKRSNLGHRVILGPRAEVRRLNRMITLKARPIGLINFSARQTARGVTATVLRSGGRRLYTSAFMATLIQGNLQVVKRKTRKRIPLRTLYGPSMREIWEKDLRQELVPLASANLQRFTRQGIEKYLAKQAARLAGGS